MVIAIDFDGTCVTHEFPLVGKDIGAASVLKKLVDNGHKLILFTMRSNRSKKNPTQDSSIQDTTGNFLNDAIQWFEDNDIELYGVQSNPTQKNWTTSPKCYAELYIDDAALGTPLIHGSGRPYIDWNKVEDLLIEMGLI